MLNNTLNFDEQNQRVVTEVEQFVENLLNLSGVSKEGSHQRVWLILHHQFMAMKMSEQLNDEEKVLLATKQKLGRGFFDVKFNLKEKKRKKTKEGSSLLPISKEKEKKEKVQKTLSLAGREISTLDEGQQEFWRECQQYIGHPYDEQMIQAFFYYWAERVIKSGLMLWETKRSWNTCLRLARWAKKSYYFDNRTAASRYNRMKRKQAQETAAVEQQRTASEQQRAIAAEREQETARREEELQQAKANSITMEQFLAEHPDSNLKMFGKK